MYDTYTVKSIVARFSKVSKDQTCELWETNVRLAMNLQTFTKWHKHQQAKKKKKKNYN